MSRLLKLFITASVLLNLLLAGVVIGHVGRDAMGPHRHMLEDFGQSLPQDQRTHFDAIMQQEKQDTGEMREQLSDARKQAANLLKAEPFDKASYLAQVQVIQRLRGQIMQRMAEAVAQMASQSPPDTRAALADMLRHPLHMPEDAPDNNKK